MRTIVKSCLVLFLIVGVRVGTAQSQNIFVEQEQLQRQIDQLKSDVDELRSNQNRLRKALLNQAVGRQQTSPEKPSPKVKPAPQALTADEQEKIKMEVCQAVGQFFTDIDRALEMADGNEAESLMKKALARFHSELDRFGQLPRVRSIINLGEGLAWDTYTAVELRYSPSGNLDFVSALQDYKIKYRKICQGE